MEKNSRKQICLIQNFEDGHYDAAQNISDEDALESFQWAEEFMKAVKDYLEG
jgi:hypothetical protein